ncbi:MAG TPA: anthranilate synthase component I [Candidatus Omnitrophota bacterium]|nr:anthranilate synthase component I [Candidatus Omnitrophota bacterium]HPD85294.1 anthranilate synthase component I [Candidatus Omnitrophota bacterium]HRZ04205.1 anthranilate synthase component I [Candidatus Omnitrophota bacterium]
MVHPSSSEFLTLSQKGNLIPIYKEILGDLETPVSAYFKLAQHAKYSFLLESVEGEEKIARYSFLAKDPELVFESKDRTAQIIRFENDKPVRNQFKIVDSPLSFLREIMAQYKLVPIAGLPRFCGGMVGFLGYDTVRFFENLPHKPVDTLSLPDALFILAKNLVIFDHVSHKIKIVSCAHINSKASRQEKLRAYRKAEDEIGKLIHQLNMPLPKKQGKITRPEKIKVASNFSQPQFEKIVIEAKKKITAGDIIQVVLSQRFRLKLQTDPFNVYRALRSVNPSPYMYCLNFGDLHIIGSSPEMLVRCEDGIVETRPIAGTRPRGKNDAEDQALIKDLLADPKERAEHTMLVDLGRNDLGRVCKNGTVKVSEFMSIEKYSHVMHIVSSVTGTLRHDKDPFDVLQAAFPAGTVSGAPKIRAMEIIDELETVSRGPYAGCVGYFSFSGNLDTCITIRTIVVSGRDAYVQAGGGIVADSNPKNEYLETVNKAKAPMMAIHMAQEH